MNKYLKRIIIWIIVVIVNTYATVGVFQLPESWFIVTTQVFLMLWEVFAVCTLITHVINSIEL